MKAINNKVTGYKGIEVPYTVMLTEDYTKKLAIFLPGAGYTTKSPLFHFAEEIFLDKSYDVLRVNYQYTDKAYDEFTMEELDEAIVHDVRLVISEVLKGRNYQDFYLVGKSLGTIAMGAEMERSEFNEAKAVWVTPLLNRERVLNTMVNTKNAAQCYIGDKDRYYSPGAFELLKANPNLELTLLPDINHRLDSATDPLKSIDALKQIIAGIKNF
ncbi:alpha/beta hydrolase [Planococcus antarcticus DSM 14505]|uniref:Alpha/beta hydrolase n=1 Tax=Planococcus antarcticus DSM 14505 TaxID=1185653 RepID=A0ABM6D933_9BACL|nr:alpha/beta hydrolase [Planococcus antarcticus]ANU12023.1 alpha/beta hydrolase [Planococcus antarcticus DSM 14505]